MKQQYKVNLRSDDEYVELPDFAVFEIDLITAQEIAALSKIVKDNGLHKVEKFDYRVEYFDDNVVDDDGPDVPNDIRIECPCLNVSDDQFWFTAYIKHTSAEICTDHVNIQTMLTFFGLEPESTTCNVKSVANQQEATQRQDVPVKILIEIEDGLLSQVSTSVAAQYVVYDHDTEGADLQDLKTVPYGDGSREVWCTGVSNPQVDPGFVNVAFQAAADGLTNYRVTLHEEAGDKFQLVFDCQAEDADHAVEQAQDAYPGCQIIGATRLDAEELSYVIYSANESATLGDGSGFWSNDDGWTTIEHASRFSITETKFRNLPMSTGDDAKWLTYETALHSYGSVALQP